MGRPIRSRTTSRPAFPTRRNSKITFNLEYHYHQAGFSDADWRSWFGAGALHVPAVDAELWYIRGYAQEQQEPVARQEAFLRADWQDAFVQDLELTAFLNSDLRDRSGFGQGNGGLLLLARVDRRCAGQRDLGRPPHELRQPAGRIDASRPRQPLFLDRMHAATAHPLYAPRAGAKLPQKL